ncbi:MAG: sensor domain-containing diguanylate cyclase, partial [Nitrolancea sp.]
VTASLIDNGEQRLVLITHQEITDRIGREISLEHYREALDSAAEVVIIADADGMIQYVNHTFTDVHGLSIDDAIGQSIWDSTGPEWDQTLAEAIISALRAGKPWREERPVESKNGTLTWEARSVSPMRSQDGLLEHLIVIGRDVTEQRAYLDQLKRHAYYDSLTGLPNRALFMDRLAHAHLRVLRSRQSLAVMYLDLNGFKSVNDSFGHGVGDQVLAEVAQRLTRSLRASDTVARTGGDEFVFLLEELATDEDAVTVAHRLIEDISLPLHITGSFISVSGSIGIVFNTPAIGEPATLLDLADIALYHAKAKGEDRVTVYHDAMEMPVNQRHDPFKFPRPN